jgi:hypothetical protein
MLMLLCMDALLISSGSTPPPLLRYPWLLRLLYTDELLTSSGSLCTPEAAGGTPEPEVEDEELFLVGEA